MCLLVVASDENQIKLCSLILPSIRGCIAAYYIIISRRPDKVGIPESDIWTSFKLTLMK